MIRRLRRISLIILVSVLGLVLVAFLVGSMVLRGSRARLDGQVELAGLSHRITVSRDALGVPDVQAQNRLDAARALGYLHAQDRFFQMDLQRRSASGELAALLGTSLVNNDRNVRRHRFRHRAEIVAGATTGHERDILLAYTAGVNAGLDDLKSRPFEYLLLRQKPEPWRPADTVLTLYAMFLDLSLSTAYTEESNNILRDTLPAELAAFLIPRSNSWNAPMQVDTVPGIVVPDSAGFDARHWSFDGKTYQEIHQAIHQPPHQDTAGSNNWAIAGHLTGHGGALLANDMHLGHGLPNIWYRARLNWSEGHQAHSVVGVTLPGLPYIVSGSNGQVAWGFTNSYGDWVDLIKLELDPNDSSLYNTPGGKQHIERTLELIQVADSEPDSLWVEETIWGPIWTTDTAGQSLVLRWTAHDPETVFGNLGLMETVNNIDEGVARAGSVGMPQQNIVMADAKGRIAWTITGYIPRRVGWDGRLPVSWADGTHGWDGYYNYEDQPRMVDPAEGRLWSANNRVSAGEDLHKIGDGGYGLGARAHQIRDDLRALDRPVEKDMLAVQLDDRAIFLNSWRDLILQVVQQDDPREDSPRYKFLLEVRDNWSGHADVESVSYRLVRSFAYQCINGVYDFLTASCEEKNQNFRVRMLSYRHAVTWELITARPDNFLPPWNKDWDDFMLQAVDKVMEGATADDRTLPEFTWGNRNTVQIAHPFTQLAPWLSRFLAVPAMSLPGDSFMPRVQHIRSGASERLVVSPGREEQGILHMPGGQSGHPLSPFFLAGHEDWVEGKPTPLLPGPALHQLELLPAIEKR